MVGSPRVLGLGSCGVDLLAYVAKYPEPDAKVSQSASQSMPASYQTPTTIC